MTINSSSSGNIFRHRARAGNKTATIIVNYKIVIYANFTSCNDNNNKNMLTTSYPASNALTPYCCCCCRWLWGTKRVLCLTCHKCCMHACIRLPSRLFILPTSRLLLLMPLLLLLLFLLFNSSLCCLNNRRYFTSAHCGGVATQGWHLSTGGTLPQV